jgi:hypothetical protein
VEPTRRQRIIGVVVAVIILAAVIWFAAGPGS